MIPYPTYIHLTQSPLYLEIWEYSDNCDQLESFITLQLSLCNQTHIQFAYPFPASFPLGHLSLSHSILLKTLSSSNLFLAPLGFFCTITYTSWQLARPRLITAKLFAINHTKCIVCEPSRILMLYIALYNFPNFSLTECTDISYLHSFFSNYSISFH